MTLSTVNSMQAFAGAGCMTYNFTATAPEAILAVQDANALLSPANPSSGPALPYSICGFNNCTSPRTIALDANTGIYYINFTGSPTVDSYGLMSHTLYAANDSGASTAAHA